MRILVTGSRDWDDPYILSTALKEAWDLGWVEVGGKWFRQETTLVHGACPTGADQMAHDIWTLSAPEDPIERYPAAWDVYGKAAGYIRNRHMVDAGADLCLAFIKNNSRGATMTADLAEKAGIPTRKYTA